MRITVLLCFFLIASCLPLEAKERLLDVNEVTSNGGIKAWLVEDHSVPIISVRFSFRGAGSVQLGPEKQGLTQLLSNTMDEGAGNMDSQAFQGELTNNSITLFFNAGRDHFGGKLKTLTRNKEKAFGLLKLALLEPRFDEDPLDRMQKSNATRILRSKTDPDWINARIMNDVVYEGHPYALNSGGTLSTLESLTKKDLIKHKNDFLTKDRLVVSVSGDIKADELKQILDDVFGDLPAKGKNPKIEKIDVQNQGQTYLFKKDIPQTLIKGILPSIETDDPDYYAYQLMNSIFGSSGFGSRLMDEIRGKRGLTYGVFSGMRENDYANNLYIGTSTKNESAKETLEIIRQEMKTMADTLVTDEEINRIKPYIIGGLALSMTSNDSISSVIHSLQLDNYPIDYLDYYAKNIKDVTKEDIQRVSKRILHPEKMVTVLVGSPEGIEGAEIIETLPNVE